MRASSRSIARVAGALWMLAAVGCSNDNGFKQNEPDPNDGPIIEVPALVEFDSVESGGLTSEVVTIRNTGNATLQVSSVGVESSTAYAVSFPQAQYIEPDATFDVVVDYTPINIEDNGILVVNSNDPAMPQAHVALHGAALVPVLQIEPSPMSFDEIGVCQTDTNALTLMNVGTADLVIDSLTATGTGFKLVLGDTKLPLTLGPNESESVSVRFTPLAAEKYEGEVWATTNEATGATSVSLTGEGGESGRFEATDTFRQSDGPWEETDIMFYVDHSLSMANDLVNLADNFNVLIAAVTSLDANYQIMVATLGDGRHNGAIITPDTMDPVTEFTDAVLGPSDADYTEAGLHITMNAFEESKPGGYNEGFLRDGAKTVAVLVSDEPDQSPEPLPDLMASILGFAPTTSIAAIVGDVPKGCGGTADAGEGYVEAATMYTDGQFLSICTDDWGEHLKLIADLAAGAPSGTFALNYLPDPSTIVTSVGTNPTDTVVASSWTYDPVGNAVVFEKGKWPDPGAWISIEYELSTECETSG